MADGGDIVRRVTIQATGDGIDSTTDSVNKLGDALDSTGSKANGSLWSQMAIGIIGVGAAAVGAYAGVKAFIDLVGEQATALSDLSDHADIAAMSAKQFQETMYAAMSKGVSASDFSSGMDKIAGDLVAASQGATEFTKLLEANGKAIKDNAGNMISVKTALGDVMSLMQNATPAVQQRLAQIVGVSQSWIPFLKEGTDQFTAQKKAAEDLGVVIDDATIAKAKQFSDEWHTAVAGWDLQFKASMADILPMLIQAAGLAKTIIDGVSGVGGTVNRWMTPVDDQSSKQLESTMTDALRLYDMVDKLGGTASGLRANNLAGLLGIPEGASIQDVENLIQNITNLYDKANSRVRVDVGNPQSGTTVLPANDDANAFTRAQDQMEKRIATLKAEADAAGEDTQFQSQLRAEYELYAAAEKAGIPVTDAMAASIRKLSTEFGNAASEAQKAKTAADIKFAGQTAMLSPEDVKIATQLKGQFDSVADALNSDQAAAIRFNDAVKSITDTARSIGATIGTDIVNGLRQGNSLAQSFADTMANVSKTLTSKAFTDLLSGNFAQAAVEAAAALATALFSTDNKAQQQAASVKAAQDQQAITDRKYQYDDASWNANIDTSTVSGQLQAFDVQANDQRRAEEQAGNQAIVELEQSLAVQRKAIVDKANQQVLKSYQDFLDSIKTGSLSNLSPEDQLKYAQDLFNKDIQGAKNGDQASIDAVTKDAQNLLTIAQSYYASSSGYSDVYKGVTDAITNLDNSGGPYKQTVDTNAQTGVSDVPGPLDQSSAFSKSLATVDPNGTITGHASGGLITNGIKGIDSLFALVAGGEYVTKTSSVNASTIGALQYINNTGKAPAASNDNGDLVRIVAQGFNGQTKVLADKLDNVVDRIQKLEDRTRIASTQRRIPGAA